MDFMLLFHEADSEVRKRGDPKEGAAYHGAWMAYVAALRGSGVVKAGAGLQPAGTATTVCIRDGRRQVQDGPFADTREQLGGFFVIDVPTLDQALEWAARAPCAATGRTEVRPVMQPPAPSA